MTYDKASGLHLPDTVTTADELAAVAQSDEERERRLRQLGLEMRPDPELDAFTGQLARAAGTEFGMVNLFFPGRQYFAGLHAPEGGDGAAMGRAMSREDGFCPAVMTRELPLVLPDVRDSPRFDGNAVVDDVGLLTYAGVRIVDEASGIALGTFCVVGTEPKPLEEGVRILGLMKDRLPTVTELLYRHAPRALR